MKGHQGKGIRHMLNTVRTPLYRLIILLNAWCLFQLPAVAMDRDTTADISLLNHYFYRLMQRADTMAPAKGFSSNFQPLSIRESKALFRKNDLPAFLKTRAERYYEDESAEEKIETFSIRPLTELHLAAVYSEKEDAPLTNAFGAEMDGHTYGSAIAGGEAYLKDAAVFSYNIRLSNDGDVDTVDLFRCQLKTGFDHIAVALTKDNIVTGPGYFGSLMQSRNVQPENSVVFKTEVPYDWGVLGAFRWYAWHTWFDDDERLNRDPRLLGARISLAPWDVLEVGFTRTALYGGSENAAYDSLDAYWEMFTGINENEPDNPYNSQQQASFDLALYLPFLRDFTPFAGGKIYLEYAFTDIKAFWQSEDRGSGVVFTPLSVSYLAGMTLTTGKTDFVLEYLQTSRNAYTSGGSGFSDGYTDNGYIIGHFAGGNCIGTMGEIYHELFERLHVDLSLGYFSHRSFAEKEYRIEKIAGAGLTFFLKDSLCIRLMGTYQHSDKTDIDPSPIRSAFIDEAESNTMLHFRLDYNF